MSRKGSHLEPPQPYAGLCLAPGILTTVIDHLQTAAPLEGVGLLAVFESAPDYETQRETVGANVVHAARFYPGTNIDASRTRFTMDPREVLAAFNDMAAQGWRLGAIVHSHPASDAVPSRTDLQEAYYPEALTVIVSLARGHPELRAWRLSGGTTNNDQPFQEVPVRVDDMVEHSSSMRRVRIPMGAALTTGIEFGRGGTA